MSYPFTLETEFYFLLGKTIIAVETKDNNHEIQFTLSTGEKYALYHAQDCCEHVYIESIVGDLKDLLNSPITLAEEVSNSPDFKQPDPVDPSDDKYGTYTWTFYKLATIKGYVDIRFYGSSNGYYSERVAFTKIPSSSSSN